jgi:shikimate kinase
MEKNIVLIGFMGTGKSSVGMRLAHKLNMQFIDMDREIERITGLSISNIFKLHGELRFRSEEKLLSGKLACQSGLVIATGGGVVLEQENINALSQNGILICLEASAQEIFERVNRRKGTRPLLKKNLHLKDVEDMLQARESFYAQANYRVNTSHKSPEQVTNEIVGLLKSSEE